MPPIPDLSFLTRVRWGNVALAALVAAVVLLLVAWPHLRAGAPALPAAAPRPTAAPRPVAATHPLPPPPEFGVEQQANRPTTTTAVPAAPVKHKHSKPRPRHRRTPHRHHPAASTPTAPAPAPVAPPPAPAPAQHDPPTSVGGEFGGNGEFGR